MGPVNLPVTRLFVEEVILECRQKHITRVDILGFEFEMGLFPIVGWARHNGLPPLPLSGEGRDEGASRRMRIV